VTSTERAAAAADTNTGDTNALRVRAFRWLWFNQLGFFLVTNAIRFVYGWVVLDAINGTEFEQGAVIFFLGIPMVFLLLPAGVWADRMDRRKLLMATQGAFGLVMIATAVLLGAGQGSLTMLSLSALLAGSASAIGSPVRVALVPEVLPPHLLSSGIAFGALAMTSSLILGPVTAKLVGDIFSFDGVFWYLAILVAIGLAALTQLEVPARESVEEVQGASDAGMFTSLAQSFRFLWDHRALRTLMVLLGVSGLIMSPIMFVTLQAFVKEELGRDAGDAAPLFALMGAGIACSSLYVMKRGDMANKGRLFTRAMLGGTTTIALMGLTTAYWQLIPLAFFMGLCGGFFINMNQSLVQANTPADLMGRVMGLYTLVQAGLVPFGALGLGWIATQAGVGNTITGGSVVAFSIVLIIHLRGRSLREL